MKLYFDGGCKPNPGAMEVAVVSENGSIKEHAFLQHGTNNEAEWLAFLWALRIAEAHADQPVTILGDSKLVISQALGEWKVKHEGIKPYHAEFLSIRSSFKNLKLLHVRRHLNLAGIYIEQIERA